LRDKRLGIRVEVISAVFLLALAALGVRLYAIQVRSHDFYAERAARQQTVEIPYTAERGLIVDRFVKPYAVSVASYSVFADPGLVPLEKRGEVSRLVAGALGIDPNGVRYDIEHPTSPNYVRIRRRVGPEAVKRLTRLMEDGKTRHVMRAIGLQEESMRVYPQETRGAVWLGFTNVDEVGCEGLELVYNNELSGSPGFARVHCDGRRRVVVIRPEGQMRAVPGAMLVLTINSAIQDIAEETIAETYDKFEPEWALAIVMDPATGEILALAQAPGYDPSSPGDYDPAVRKNHAVATIREPGSTFKPFVMACALELGLVTPETPIYCEQGTWQIGPRTLHDHHPYGWLKAWQIIQKSSNIGIAKVGRDLLGIDRLHALVTGLGFGQPTGLELPGEVRGIVRPLSTWTLDYSAASIPMGQEIGVTPIQLITAFAAVVNGGTLLKPRIVRGVMTADGTDTLVNRTSPVVLRRVYSAETSKVMRERFLRPVVESDGGTGRRARSEKHVLGGKTGTAQNRDPDGTYSHTKFTSSFLGFGPVDDPRVVVLVMLNEPSRGASRYGGSVAAPAAGRILERTLDRLSVPPAKNRTAARP